MSGNIAGCRGLEARPGPKARATAEAATDRTGPFGAVEVGAQECRVVGGGLRPHRPQLETLRSEPSEVLAAMLITGEKS